MGQIDALFSEYTDATPGCAVAVLRGGEASTHSYGMSDLERPTPITPQTRFNLGSASKQFTAFAVLLLEEDGLLSMDDEARRHLPELRDFGPQVTLRHLMHHTSGLRDTYPDLLMLAGWRFADDIRQRDALRLIFGQRELSFAPGSEHLYVNANYVLLAEIVARVSGGTMGEFLTARVLEPLGMSDTLVMDDVYRLMPDRAQGYYEADGAWHIVPLTDSVLGSTNVYSTAADMAGWLRNLREHVVGGARVWEQMLTSGTLDDGTAHGYGGGLQVGPGAAYRGHAAVEHGGQHGGYCTSTYWFPDDDLGIVLLFNHYLWETRARALGVADLFLEGGVDDAPPPSVDDRRVEVAAEELERLAGTFYDETRRAVRRVDLTDGSLIYMGLELVPTGPGTFTFAEDPAVEVRIDDAGLVVETPDRPYSYRRMEPFEPDGETLAGYAGRYASPELEAAWEIAAVDGGLTAHRPRHVDTPMRPIFADAFVDDWSEVFDFPGEFLIEFEGDAGEITGFRVSGGRARGIWFERRI